MFSKALQGRGAIVAWADRASYWIFVLLLGYISLVPFYYLQPLSLERVSFHFLSSGVLKPPSQQLENGHRERPSRVVKNKS